MHFEPIERELPKGIDSKEELYFEWWLNDLYALGYVKSYSRSYQFKILDKVNIPCLKHKPTKKDPNRFLPSTKNLLHGWNYTPDYNVIWTEKSKNLFFKDISVAVDTNIKTYFYAKLTQHGYMSVIDVKPIQFRSGITSTSVKFPHIQKMMMYLYDIYINKACPTGKGSLFATTFTPDRYLLQDKKPNKRRISQWPVVSAEYFIKQNSKQNDFKGDD